MASAPLPMDVDGELANKMANLGGQGADHSPTGSEEPDVPEVKGEFTTPGNPPAAPGRAPSLRQPGAMKPGRMEQ